MMAAKQPDKHFKSLRWVVAGAVATLVVALIVGYGYYFQNLKSVGSSSEQQTFTVTSGESATQVAAALKRAKLIRNQGVFVTYLNFHGLRTQLKAGTYSLNGDLDVPQVADRLSAGKVFANRLVVPEGSSLTQIANLAAKRGIPASEFTTALSASYSSPALAGRPAGVSLEGYLFPDSYDVQSGTTAGQVITVMLETFGRKVGPEYQQAFAAQGLTLHQGLTVASIVEREVSNRDDRPVVAQIFLKRFREGQPLGSDVTTEYASKLQNVAFDLNLNSPYNTRKVTGLPPGPICSPGLSAMDAVAHPASTDYTFFLSGNDGKTYFARTYAEHQQNIRQYLK